jgi:predicted DNA-binding transcriptional regulator AlpA
MDTLVPELESDKQVNARTGIGTKVLQKWRLNGEGPPWYRIGPQLVRYKRAEVDAWITSRAGVPDRRHNPEGHAQLTAERQTGPTSHETQSQRGG